MVNKRIKKKQNKQLQQRLSQIFEDVKDEDVIRVNENGVVQIDFSNPKHVKTYERWISE